MKGARELIGRARPFIIFEYNHVSRAHFFLEEVRAKVGPEYEVMRLAPDGRLDHRLERTWNCIAVPRAGPFVGLRARLVRA